MATYLDIVLAAVCYPFFASAWISLIYLASLLYKLAISLSTFLEFLLIMRVYSLIIYFSVLGGSLDEFDPPPIFIYFLIYLFN